MADTRGRYQTTDQTVFTRIFGCKNKSKATYCMRDKLPFMIFSLFQELPQHVSNKLAQVIIDIGKQDWPDLYPEFLQHICAIVQVK